MVVAGLFGLKQLNTRETGNGGVDHGKQKGRL